jgi:hypothetical protein
LLLGEKKKKKKKGKKILKFSTFLKNNIFTIEVVKGHGSSSSSSSNEVHNQLSKTQFDIP